MDKLIYINGLNAISPQRTYDLSQLPDSFEHVVTNRLKASEPGYKEFIPADMVRRMGRIIKMGVAAARLAMHDAGCLIPDAIITGTGLGCLEDTEKFLTNLIRNNEEFLTPTNFIQSTHNTVGAQIALLIKCHGYNFTYCHRGISFESALTDSLMQIQSNAAGSVLTGGIDELTEHTFAILNRMGFWKQKPGSTQHLFGDSSRGTVAGEGAAFFLLESEKRANSYASVKGVQTIVNPESAHEVSQKLIQFISRMNIDISEISLVMSGANGDPEHDQYIQNILNTVLKDSPVGHFKHLCGEYHTASAFGMWLSARMIREQRIPDGVVQGHRPGEIKHILVCNNYRNINHGFILLSRP